ncbi:hypothetical protein PQJ75_13940 [Rhodoplanes sp. TEM]|uniref:Uncharacterized protein n=1 Tax=Rhodoplanes tepidamans TaxID=200616 RepID=A0ABT5JEA0_RHOTP|nr:MULTISPECIES: hypothetical protein [Rhodoplanes]MDC7787993.1 hypothetical protein [Rhodoplanes tepidamans]MDC7984833.1 hypothetical protein [Rhodoplanes sp. TEM]MDQ0358422.1 hypothetical protein [Rhodoplanes tepidamans]
MPVHLGREIFPDEVMTADWGRVMRIFLERVKTLPLAGTSARDLIDLWMHELKIRRRNAARRREA